MSRILNRFLGAATNDRISIIDQSSPWSLMREQFFRSWTAARRVACHSRNVKRGTNDKQEHGVEVANAACDDKEMPDPMEMKAPVVKNQKHGAGRIIQPTDQNPS